MKLSDGQRATVIRFLTNAGTITLGGLVVGPFIGPPPVRWHLFVAGVALYAGVLWVALRLDQGKGDI